MELEELIENTLRRKHLEEMIGRPEKEHTPLEGMDNEQIKRFALFLFEENQKKSRLLDEMIINGDRNAQVAYIVINGVLRLIHKGRILAVQISIAQPCADGKIAE